MSDDLIFTSRPRYTFLGRRLPLALDRWLDQPRTRSGFHVARRVMAITGWMLCGAVLVTMLGLHYVPRRYAIAHEAALNAECHVVRSPALDAALAAQGIQHAGLAEYGDAFRSWKRTVAEGKPPTRKPVAPGNAWRVCEGWMAEERRE